MKNIKIIGSLLLLFTAITFTSCDNEPIDPAINLDDFGGGNNNTGTYTATIGSVQFNAQTIVAEYSDSAFGPELNIAGLMQDGQTMNIQIINPAVGTRAGSSNFSNLLFFQYSASLNDVYSSFNNDTNVASGTITITSFDLTTKKVSGTFSFTAFGALNSATQKEVTNGVFNNITFEDTSTGGNTGGGSSSSVVGTYLLTAFNTSVPTDLNGDGTTSTNQMNETSCFNNSLIKVFANNTFSTDAKGIDIAINVDDQGVEVETIECFEDPQITGTWVLSGNVITFNYTDQGDQYSDSFTIVGNTLKYTLNNGQVVGTELTTGAPVYLTSDITLIYTKQ